RVQCASNLRQLTLVYSTYAQESRDYLPDNPVPFSTDPLWFTTALRDTLVNDFGLLRQILDCPAVGVAPKTTLYYPGTPWSWATPYDLGGGLKMAPTGYATLAGRSNGYQGVITTAWLPIKIDERKKMAAGATITPWFLCYTDWDPLGGWFPREA